MTRQGLTLMGLWVRHKPECRPIGRIVADARDGNLPGVRMSEHGYRVIDANVALDAMRR